MKISSISLYIAWQIFIGVIGLSVMLTALVFLVDLIESLRFIEKIPNTGLKDALIITSLRILKLTISVAPFVTLFGAMIAFYRLNRRSELAVMRSAGVSVWGIVGPGAFLAVMVGVLLVGVIDPIASDLSARSETYKNEIRGKTGNLLKSLQGGIWLRQKDGDTSVILHADSYSTADNVLTKVTIWRRSLSGVFIERWDADRAIVRDKGFELQDAKRKTLDSQDKTPRQSEWVPSAFSVEELSEDVARPEAMSIWDLPAFIALAEEVGLPSIKYRLRYHELWSMPLTLLAMIMIAAAFTMRPIRGGGTAKLILAGLGAGFLLFIVAEFSSATAEARITPVVLAAWTPAILALLLSLTLLLYREDG